jgi:transposase InsO family protein
VPRASFWLSLQQVLTDGGGEFKAEFDAACEALGIRHTRIRPRHAWTNGFVERLQQTILPSIGAWCSDATTSPVAPRSIGASLASCSSTTSAMAKRICRASDWLDSTGVP